MHSEWMNPELFQQTFENAMEVMALSFIALTMVAAVLVYFFIVGECFRLTRRPAQARHRLRLIIARPLRRSKGLARVPDVS